jgi:hypothetical protein
LAHNNDARERQFISIVEEFSGGSRRTASHEQLSKYKELMVRVEELRRDCHSSQSIAIQLDSEGFHPPGGNSFNATTVRRLLSRTGSDSSRDCQPPRWRLRELAEKLDIPCHTAALSSCSSSHSPLEVQTRSEAVI